MRKICVCGHFGFGHNMLNGQTIKTKIVTNELEREYGKDELYTIDTHGRWNTILMFFRIIYALATCRNIIIMPAQTGILIIPLWVRLCNTLFKRCLHYIVIGGWIANRIESHKIIKWSLSAFHTYTETTTMQKALNMKGIKKVSVLPNCKHLKINHTEELQSVNIQRPLRLVTFSRVMKMKGIGDAARIVTEINKELGEEAFTLDIYGQVESGESLWFSEEQKKFSSSVVYKGTVDFDKSVETLSSYFALLFPTHFYTEGIPGTIIDAYAAGLPVISARWESFHDIIDEGSTGIGYDFDNTEQLKDILIDIWKKPSIITGLKCNCTSKAKSYLPENVIPNIALE